MSPSRIASPEPVELVPADEMLEFIARMDAEFQALELRAAEANADADQAEERARQLGLDDVRAPAAMAALQRFLDEWRARVDDEARAVVEAARLGARVRLDEAHAAATRLRRSRSQPTTSAVAATPPDPAVAAADVTVGTAPTAPQPLVVAAPVLVSPVVVDPVVPTPTPIVEPVPVVTPVVVAPVPASPPSVATDAGAPAMNGNGALDDLLVGLDPIGHTEVVEPPKDLLQPSTGAAIGSSFDALAPDAAPTSANEQPFWPAAQPPTRARRLRRLPISAMLEVVAVLLVLVFILLRLS